MNAKLEKLMFQIGVLDKASAPISKIQNKLQSLTDKSDKAFNKIAAGAAGLAASAYTALNALQPAREIGARIGEVASLDVPIEELQRLENAAYKSAAKYGDSAANFIAASYDIQSAISGLKPGQLGTVTAAMNTLAIATKADVANMTSLMGSMYGIFQDEALAMGVDQFSEKVAAVTAKSVQIFKTEGKAMEDAFRGIGLSAKTHGIAMEEQFAVLGSLQATMPGAEAGTKYAAFLGGVVNAQEKLKLSFVDSHGKMLPMVDILEKIKTKYGDIDSIEMGALSKAFGSKEAVAVVADLIKKTDQLRENVTSVANADFSLAETMAGKIADPWDKASQGLQSLVAKMGGLFLPAVNGVMDRIALLTLKVMDWVDANPELSRTLIKVATVVFGLFVGLSALAFIIGLSSFALGGLATVLGILFSPITLIVAAVAGLVAGAYYLYTNWGKVSEYLSQSTWGRVLLAMVDNVISKVKGLAEIIETVLIFAFAGLSMTVETIIDGFEWLYNTFGNLISAFLDTSWGQTLVDVFAIIMSPVDAFNAALGFIASGWDTVKASLSDTSWGQALLSLIDKISAGFKALIDGWQTVKSFTGDKLDKLSNAASGAVSSVTNYASEKATQLTNKVTEITDDVISMMPWSDDDSTANKSDIDGLKSSLQQNNLLSNNVASTVPYGGVSSQFVGPIRNRDRLLNQQAGRRVQVGQVTIQVPEVDAERLMHELEMM